MYGIFTYIYHKHQPNVGKYTIHGSYGVYLPQDPHKSLERPGSISEDISIPYTWGKLISKNNWRIVIL